MTATLLAAFTAVAAAIIPTLVFASRGAGVRLMALVAGSAAGCVVLFIAGADLEQAARETVPLVLIVGYSLVASVIARSGTARALAAPFASSPLWVFAIAASLTLITSNDTVILTLAPLALLSARPAHAAAALFVGANVSAALLPQASPTNMMLASVNELSFREYVAMAAPVGFAMIAVAALAVAACLRPAGNTGSARPRPPLSRDERLVLVAAALAVAAQPAADALGLETAGLGVVVALWALLLAKLVGVPVGRVLGDGAWLVLPVSLVMLGAGGLLAPAFPSGGAGVLALFASAGVTTDLAAAATGAHLSAAGAVPVAGVLIAVTAGAFLSPIGSLSGLLLYQQFHLCRVRVPYLLVYGFASCVAVAALTVGVAILWLTP